MDVLLFGATGMVGQGVLHECLRDPEVERITAVGRRTSGGRHAKLRDLVVPNVADLSAVEAELSGFDACFFCLGVSSAGMSEARYTALTYDLTLAVARTLVRLNPAMTFVYVSGMATDGTERGRVMWARVKGRTENALRSLGFRATYAFRPGFIQPLAGTRSKTRLYRAFYALTTPLFPLLRRAFPSYVTTAEEVGRAMIAAARRGYSKPVLETVDINELATGASG